MMELRGGADCKIALYLLSVLSMPLTLAKIRKEGTSQLIHLLIGFAILASYFKKRSC